MFLDEASKIETTEQERAWHKIDCHLRKLEIGTVYVATRDIYIDEECFKEGYEFVLVRFRHNHADARTCEPVMELKDDRQASIGRALFRDYFTMAFPIRRVLPKIYAENGCPLPC